MAPRHALLYVGVFGVIFGLVILPLLEHAFPDCPWLRTPGTGPAPLPPPVDASSRVWTLDELRQHDGRDSEKAVHLSIGGYVLDVSGSGSRFYSPGAEYSQFAGRAATRALSIGSLDLAEISDDVADFSERQRVEMDERILFYVEKYPVVGTLAGTLFEHTDSVTGTAGTRSKEDSTAAAAGGAAPPQPKPLYDADQLSRYDGSCSDEGLCRSIYVAVGGDIFNVTKLRGIYGPGRPRSVMAGKGITRSLVRLHMAKEQGHGGADTVLQEAVSDDCTQFTDEEQNVAAEQSRYFHANFPHVGRLVGWN